jgi:hypothetical protein
MAQETRASFLGAAIRVLEACQRPMTAREIAEEALRRGWLTSAGKTPHATMAARLYFPVRDDPDSRLVCLAQPGKARAVRGSVRWALRTSR